MTTKATINSGLAGGGRSDSLDVHAEGLYERPHPVVALVELVPVDRTEPVDSASKKARLVRLRIEALEVAAAGEQERILRDVLRLLFVARTADGTLDAENEVKVLEQILERVDGLVGGELVASLVAIIEWTVKQIREIADSDKLRPVDVRKALGQVADKAAAARLGVQAKDGPQW